MDDKEKVVKVTSKEQVIELFGRPYWDDEELREMWKLFRTPSELGTPLRVVRAKNVSDDRKPDESSNLNCNGPCCRRR